MSFKPIDGSLTLKVLDGRFIPILLLATQCIAAVRNKTQ